MKTDAICALPIAMLAGENAHLYLWVTNNFLRDGFRVLDAWGFRYITLITWKKQHIGLGQYFRGMTEHCMFAVRGNLPYRTHMEDGEEKRNQGKTFLEADRTEHSKKPDQVRQWIEQVSYPPYLELFALEEFDGWDRWGNEVGTPLAIEEPNLFNPTGLGESEGA
jgi:N6-adenosine-specific RNA methylase IME4